MKKVLIIGFAALVLSACGNEDVVKEEDTTIEETDTIINEEVENDPTQDELNAKLKEEAVKADFVELGADNPPNGKSVYIDGEVSVLMEDVIDQFTLTAKEGDGYGIYHIKLINTTDIEYSNGDTVRIYGTVKGKDEGFPLISATILEQK